MSQYAIIVVCEWVNLQTLFLLRIWLIHVNQSVMCRERERERERERAKEKERKKERERERERKRERRPDLLLSS